MEIVIFFPFFCPLNDNDYYDDDDDDLAYNQSQLRNCEDCNISQENAAVK